jgi:hypothetical protein
MVEDTGLKLVPQPNVSHCGKFEPQSIYLSVYYAAVLPWHMNPPAAVPHITGADT